MVKVQYFLYKYIIDDEGVNRDNQGSLNLETQKAVAIPYFQKQSEEAGVIESVKAVNEVYSPVGGVVTEINERLSDEPSLINTSCYEEGWMYKLEMSDLKEIDSLMDEEAYEKYLKSIH